MANQHRLDSPILVEKDDKLIITITFYMAGYLPKNAEHAVTCRLQVYHDAVQLEDDQLLFDKQAQMKLTSFASQVYTLDFSVDRQKGGKISLDLTLVKSADSSPLAKATYRLGPTLNAPVKIRRNDQAPRMLQALNTAAGPKAKPTSSHPLNDILEHVHAALVDNDGFRKGIASSIDGALSSRRQLSPDKLVATDEQLSLVITEKFLGLPYQMAGNVYGNCYVPDVNKKARLVHLNNDVFWERMRPSSAEITYPWCTECQQLTTMVNYLRGVDIWALAPGAKGELGAQRASFKVAEAAGGTIIDESEAKGALASKLYTDANFPLGPGDFFVFNDEKHRITEGGKEKIVSGSVVRGYSDEERKAKQPKPIPAQSPENHPHISCILRVFKRAGNYFFQLMDTGGQPPYSEGYPIYRRRTVGAEGICDGRFTTAVRPDGDAAGVAPCVGIGIWPKKYKTDFAKLERALERARFARPVALARLHLVERATGALLYATPLLRTYTNDREQNFSPARLAWSLRNVPHASTIEAFWSVWAPRGPLARRLIDSRHTSLFDVRSEFASGTTPSKEFNNVLLSKFPYVEAGGFLFLQNIVALGPTTAEELHADAKVSYRFPSDDADPDYYKQFGYVEVSKINSVHSPKSWVQDKKFDLNTYVWDRHVFGDQAIRLVTAQVTKTDTTQDIKMLESSVEIDAAQFSQIAGKWYTKGLNPASPIFDKGKLLQAPGGKRDGQVAASASDPKQSVSITLPADVAALANQPKVHLYVELAMPVIDKRFARPDKFDSYPYFRGDFPVKPSNCPGNPKPDECPDFLPACPKSCQYIVRLRGLTLGGSGKLDAPFDPETLSYSGSVSYLDGDALTLRASASCKATIEIKLGSQTLTTASGVESAPLRLSVGSNTIDVTATTLNNTTKHYQLKIERAKASKEHSLDDLRVAPGKLVQAADANAGFAPGTFAYEVVDTQDGKLGFTPKLTNPLAKLSVDGKPHASETEIVLAMTGFKAHTTTFEVVAEDGQSSKYEVVYRRGDANVELKTLRVLVNFKDQTLIENVQTGADQAANPDTESYTVEVPDDTTRVRFVAVAAAETSKVFLDGQRLFGAKTLELSKLEPQGVEGEPPLQVNGPSIARIEVEAQNGRRRTYELEIRRPKDKVEAED